MTVIGEISRKMRTSMNTLNGMVTIARERIARGGNAAETLSGMEEAFEVIADETNRMIALLDDLTQLDVSKTVVPKSDRLASGRFAGRRILLVDDVPGNVMVISEMLSLCGAVVVTAADGQEAVDVFERSADAFDCVLMDIRMPGMDGYAAAAAIRASARPEAAGVPIVAMSAEIFDEDRRKAEQSGMNACVAKPIRFAELAETLERHFVRS